MRRDSTDRKRAEQVALQEQLIASQEAALRALGTPLMPIANGVIAMPLIGSIGAVRAQQIIETLLEGIAVLKTQVAILDITGVKVVDTHVANALLQAARAARLLGAQVILTGVGPVVAQTLVGLGVDLTGVVTLSTLQSGIAYALNGRR